MISILTAEMANSRNIFEILVIDISKLSSQSQRITLSPNKNDCKEFGLRVQSLLKYNTVFSSNAR
jgi:hypothetical protein